MAGLLGIPQTKELEALGDALTLKLGEMLRGESSALLAGLQTLLRGNQIRIIIEPRPADASHASELDKPSPEG